MEINTSPQSILAQIRDYQNKIDVVKNGQEINPTSVTQVDDTTFASNLSKAISGALSDVNELQNTATSIQSEFQMGGDIPLTEVVINMQKASLAFEATVQIRNKVLSAYQEIMNMPI